MVRVRRKLGKYRIERRLAEGGFAAVYRARDTVSGIAVALKIPHPNLVNKEMLDAFRKEFRLAFRNGRIAGRLPGANLAARSRLRRRSRPIRRAARRGETFRLPGSGSGFGVQDVAPANSQ